MALDTAGNIISRAAVQCGLGAVTDAFGSADGNVVQLREYLTQLGQRLWKKHDWGRLTKRATITTIADTSLYDTEDDYGRMLDETWWNESSRLPGTPATAQEWSFLKGQLSNGTTWTVYFRMVGGQIELWPDDDMPADLEIAYQYISDLWVMPNGETVPTLRAPTANSDVLYYPDDVLVLGLKAEFLGNKSMPGAAKAWLDYEEALDDAIAADAPPRKLNMGDRAGSEPMLSMTNVPDTGYGE